MCAFVCVKKRLRRDGEGEWYSEKESMEKCVAHL